MLDYLSQIAFYFYNKIFKYYINFQIVGVLGFWGFGGQADGEARHFGNAGGQAHAHQCA